LSAARAGREHATAKRPENSQLGDATEQDSTADPDYRKLLEAIGWDAIDTDTAARRSGLTAAEVSSMLLILELQGRVDALTGGRYVRRGTPSRDAIGALTEDHAENRR
jgi:predicted Rossmann fold nucleotide-binding protein DprA/Smf involved in DNA uptake